MIYRPKALDKRLKELKDRVDNIADGWARDVAAQNRALSTALVEMRRENRKLVERMVKLERQAGIIND